MGPNLIFILLSNAHKRLSFSDDALIEQNSFFGKITGSHAGLLAIKYNVRRKYRDAM